MIIYCFFIIVITSTAVYSQSVVIGPDDPNYIANVIEEALQVGEVRDPAQRILLLQQMLEERIEEIELAASENKSEYIPSLVKAYEAILKNIEDTTEQVDEKKKGVNKALEIAEKSTKKHIEILTDLLEKVPSQAKLAIEHAIEVSKTGRNTALNRLKNPRGGGF